MHGNVTTHNNKKTTKRRDPCLEISELWPLHSQSTRISVCPTTPGTNRTISFLQQHLLVILDFSSAARSQHDQPPLRVVGCMAVCTVFHIPHIQLSQYISLLGPRAVA
mmetsp:Transcript_8432/g.14314  ORF Transcript_8432/g.14314 Transcript_8432/m.14314 type:complete len:108 (+) Transcript_8432:37-360(+)